jgi:enoyl-CoA hydratase/carnithine racemase
VAEVEYQVRDAVAKITINRPERRNAMSFPVLQQLCDRLDDAANSEAVRVIVLTGAGDRAFSAGADLGGMGGDMSEIAAHESRGLLANVFRRLWRSDKPSIAQVRGFALAGGFGLASACDFVIASTDAEFGTPEIDVGLWPYMITVPLLQSMPARLALELMATGRRMPAREAAQVGFVNQLVPANELESAVQSFARSLAGKSPLILRLGRHSFYRALSMKPDDALDYLQSLLTVTMSSEDTAEGLSAFREKRAPRWRGR